MWFHVLTYAYECLEFFVKPMCKEHNYVQSSGKYWDTQYCNFIKATTVWLVNLYLSVYESPPMLISSIFKYFCMSTDFEWAQLWSWDQWLFFCLLVCLVGSQEPEPAVFPIAQPHSQWCSWPDFHCETFFQIKGVLWNTDILSTGRPKLGYCSWLWEFRLISLTTESRNVTPGLKLCWDTQVIQWFDLSMSESQRQMSTAEPI